MQRRISLVGTAIVRRKYGGRRAGGGGLSMRNTRGAECRTISGGFSASTGMGKMGCKNYMPFSPVPSIFSVRFLLLVIVLSSTSCKEGGGPFIRTIFVPSCRAGGVWG